MCLQNNSVHLTAPPHLFLGLLTVLPARHHNMVQAAEGEVAALQAPHVLDVAVSVGGTGPSALRQAFYRLVEQISLQYPQAVPMAEVWGYGRPSWDLAVRQHGQKPFR